MSLESDGKIKGGLSMTVYGYTRRDYPCSVVEQIELLRTFNCDNLFIEESLFEDDSELTKLVAGLHEADTVVVADFQVFGKGLKQLGDLFLLFQEKQIRFISINDHLDTSSTEGQLFYSYFQLILKEEKMYQRQSMQQSIELARQNGRTIGRPTVSPDVIEQIKQLHTSQRLSLRDIASQCGVSLGTVHKYVHEAQAECLTSVE